MDSRKKKPANSQSVKKEQNLLQETGKSIGDAKTRLMVSLIAKQPLTTEEICSNARVKVNYFLYDRSVILIKEGIIKKLNDERWAFWNYESLASKQKYGASEILRLIGILENEKMPQDSRVLSGQKLVKCCYLDSEIVDGKDILRPFFNGNLDIFESIDFVSDIGIVFTQILIALKWYVAFQLQGEKDIQWMKNECYPKLEFIFNKSGSIIGRERVLEMLSQIYRTNELDIEQQKLTTLIRMRFFDPKEEDSIAIRCRDISCGQADYKLKEILKTEIFNLANSWEKFLCHADDDLKEMLNDMLGYDVYDMKLPEKEILEKRGLEVMKKYYGF